MTKKTILKNLKQGNYILFFDEEYYCLEYIEPSTNVRGYRVIPPSRCRGMDLCLPHELIKVYEECPPLWRLIR